MFQLTFWSLPSAIATGLAIMLLRRVWRQRAAPGGWPLSLLLAAIAWWSAGQWLGTSLTTLDGKFLAAKLQYPGIVVVPTAWLLFALRYSGMLPAVARNWPLLVPIPLLTLVLALGNELHGWMWSSATLVEQGDFIGWRITYGPWFKVHTLWSYAVVGVGTACLLSALLRSPWHRRRAFLIVAAPIVVLASNALYLLPDSPMAWLDLTPLGFAAAGGIFTLALRGDILDLVPLSREQVVRDLPDAVFVIAQDGRVIDMNPAAVSLTDARRAPAGGLGRPLWDLLPIERELAEGMAPEGRPLDLIMSLNGRETAWRVNASNLVDPRGELSGRVLVFHDQSDRWRAEGELRATGEALAAANRELERLTTLDVLTRLLHRRAFLRQADEELARARRYDRTLSLLVLDLDDLADLNARSGSDVADQVLAGIARMLESLRRDGDLLGRTGAAEFALLLPETSPEDAGKVAEGIHRIMARSRFRGADGDDVVVSIRTGITALKPTDDRADLLLLRAIEASNLASVDPARAGQDSV
ncbi:MAG TPA: histidine kinase N-terminal 7TM domain-containing protein [Pseudomonadales bacterium]|nr:histidine kinase N-terminal 7TM domain-containing protein [Pseudomonadales bacterium]